MTEPTDEQPPVPERRNWWQRLPVLVLVGVVPVPFGLYFMAFVGAAMLLGDRTRDTEAKAAGAVALFWWAYSFRQGATSPFVSVFLLAVAAALAARSARRRREGGGPVWPPLAGAVAAVAVGVVAFVPYGYRQAEIGRDEAVRRVLAHREARPWRGIAAKSYLVEGGRARLIHTPQWFVALYEPHATVARTLDGQPCFSRREVWEVNALDGSVSRATHDEAAAGGDPCLPVRAGTERDLRPVPA